jgi:RsiW-degrading membrane proteinase PrsW (M82 family)
MITFHDDQKTRRAARSAPWRFQFGLSSLIWLTFGAAIILAQVTSFPLLFSDTRAGTIRALLSIILAWSLLLVIYCRKRHGPSLIAHCIGPLFVVTLVVMFLLSRPSGRIPIDEALGMCYVGFLVSELVSIPVYLCRRRRPERILPDPRWFR